MITDPVWPHNARCAVAISVEYDAESVELGYRGSLAGAFDMGAFANNFGISRILEIFERFQIPTTFFIPAWDAEHHPRMVEEIVNQGHKVAAHGYLHEDFSALAPDQEREIMEKSHTILTRITGQAPQGFRSAAYARPISPQTLTICQEMGYRYDSSFMDSDMPYQIQWEGRTLDMVEIPWTWPLNDLSFFGPMLSAGLSYVLPQRNPQWVLELWREEFDTLYAHVGFFNLVIHPRDIGRVSRLPVLESLLDYICAHDAIWFASYDQIAQHFLENASTLRQSV